MIDRTEVSRALAKALAYKACGKDTEASEWAARLVIALELEGILRPDVRDHFRGDIHRIER